MRGNEIDRRGQLRFRLAGGLALAGLLLTSLFGSAVAPVLARTCGTVTIRGGSASPGSGTTATNFQFKVHFVDTTGTAPQSVQLRINNTDDSQRLRVELCRRGGLQRLSTTSGWYLDLHFSGDVRRWQHL